MKRSEMIEVIAESLLRLHGYDAEEWNEVRTQTKMHRLKTAHIALKAAEEAGMRPPATGVMKQVDILDKWGNTSVQSGVCRVIDFDWNPEDLDKFGSPE